MTEQTVNLPNDTLLDIYQTWLSGLTNTRWVSSGAVSAKECEYLGTQLIIHFRSSLSQNSLSKELLSILEQITKTGIQAGLSPTETATFVLSLRGHLSQICTKDQGELAHQLLEQTALHTFEMYVKTREEIINQQRRDILELSTPVIKLWDGILAVPLIGTIDSRRTQQTTEKLLNRIVETGSKIAILDITGVAMVDTLVANHIIKTAAAVRLLGATLIITGISPSIAQTIVHLGIDLSSVVTRAVMADGMELAFDLLEKKVSSK